MRVPRTRHSQLTARKLYAYRKLEGAISVPVWPPAERTGRATNVREASRGRCRIAGPSNPHGLKQRQGHRLVGTLVTVCLTRKWAKAQRMVDHQARFILEGVH